MIRLIGLILSIALLTQCNTTTPKAETTAEALPFLGIPMVIQEEVDGKIVDKQVPPTVPDFKLWNQDSTMVSQALLKGKLQVVDFFFTKCPTLCPVITKSMDRIHLKFKENKEVQLISFSIDYINDSVPQLKNYATDLGATTDNWFFLECDPDQTYKVAKGYISTALEDKDAPGGYDHTGNLVLVDKDGYVRSFCDGQNPVDVERFMDDIETLLDEK